MTNLNRQPIGPFGAPEHGWDGQEPCAEAAEDLRRSKLMPKGSRKPADWDGFAMAVADAQHDEQLAAVKRDDPRIPIPQDAVWAEVKRERDVLLAENELLWAVVDIAREYAKSGTDARLSAALAALDRPRGGGQ